MMGSRSGDVDPTLASFLAQREGVDVETAEDWLNTKSGLLGVSGRSRDMRELLAAEVRQRRAVLLGRCLTVVLVAVPIGYDAYRWWDGDITRRAFAYRTFRSSVGLVTSEATLHLLQKSSYFRASPVRVGLAASAVLFAVEEGFLIYEEGGLGAAFHSPGFWLDTGTNLGGKGLGTACFIVGLSAGPYAWIVAPAGGLAGAIAGSWAGRRVIRWTLDQLAPELLYKRQLDALNHVKLQYERRIQKLRHYSSPGNAD
jgi:hypothetical protein